MNELTNEQNEDGTKQSNINNVEEDRLKQLFWSCDSNKDGFLDSADLYAMCCKLNMGECAEEILNMLGARRDGNVSLEKFLGCRRRVLQLETGTQAKFSGIGKPGYSCSTKLPDHEGNGNSTTVSKISHLHDSRPESYSNGRMGNVTTDACLLSSGGKCDPSAPDLDDEAESLHLLMRCEYSDLYQRVFPNLLCNYTPLPTMGDGNKLSANDSVSTYKLITGNPTNGSLDRSTAVGSEDSKLAPVSSASGGLNPDVVRRLFECANILHIRRTRWLRSEVRDLTHRLQDIQISQNLSLRNVQRLQRERDHLHQELSNQIARYEDRLTELHSVIAELRKRLERADAHIIREVDEIEEKEEEEEHEKDAELNERSDAVDAEADEIGSFSGNSPFPPRKNQCNCQLQRETNDSPLLTHNDYCHSDGSSDAGNTSVGAVDGDHPDLPDNDTNYGALRSNKNRLLSAGMDHDGIYNTVGVYSPLQQTQINNSSQVAATSDEAVLQARKRYSIVDYEAALARLQAKLTCVTEERDLLARQLSTASPHSVVAPGDRQSQLPCSHSPTLGQPYHSAPPPSTPTGVPPVTGMCGQLSTQKSTLIPNLSSLGQSQKPGSRSSTAYESPKHFLQNQCCTASAPPQGPDNLTSIRKNDPADNSSNVYDLPEPDWITQCLENYELATSGHPSQDQLTSGYQSSRSDEKVDDDMLSLCLEDDSSIFTGPLSPQALSVFLSNLAKSAPYPRLVEVLHCTQLTWQRLVATLSRLRADCLVLQANLTEIKANADRMQCQLNQIEANWSAAMRSAQLADASLEISDCLNQLYATELAIILYRQTRKTLLGGGAFSTLSSSTSSSSFAGRARSAQFGTGHSVPGSFNAAKQQCIPPSTCATPSSPGHPYAVYAVPGSVGTESDPSSVGVTTIPFSLRTLRLFRNQAELAAHTLLDRYGSPEGTPDRFYPTVSSTGGGGQPQLSSGMFNRGAQNQAPISPGIFSIQSALGPGVPSTQSLSSASVYANSWYVSLGRIGRVTAANGTGPSEQASVGSGSLQLNSNKAHVLNLPAPPFGTTRISPKSTATTNTFLSGMGHASGGGWQTPDSGAGSSGTNEVAQQPYLLGPFFQSPYQLLGFNPVANHGELNSYSAMLDLLPPLWSNSAHVNGNSICDSDSDSSDSSDAGAPVAASLAGLIKVSEPPQTGPLSQTHSFPLLWSRAEERKLRSLFYQLINARQVLRSTFPEQPTFGSYTDDEDLGETHQQSDLMRQGDFGLSQNAPSVASMGKLPLAVVLENSVLLQELCTIKEERAELKARVYLLEKELHSNRLTLESRTVAEKALRAHLDVLMSDNNYSRKTDDRDTSISVRTGQTETTLLRGQVKNLLQALEALRHSTELQQIQSEELVDDLRRANSALIAAYEKAKRKYLTRIKKLEDKLGVQKTCPDVNSPKHTDPRRAAHPLPPKAPEKLVSASPVRQINPSQSVRNQRLPPPPSPGAQQTQQSHISSSALPGALGGDRVVGLKPSSVHSPSPSRHCCRSTHPPGVGWPPSSTSSCVSNSRPTFVSQPSNRTNVLLSSSNQTTGGGSTATNHTRIGTTRAISPQHGP